MRNFKKLFTTLCLVFAVMLVVPYVAPTAPTAITAQAAQTVKISKTKATLVKGQTLQLKVTGTSKTVKWSTSKTSVATVSSSGKVTAVAKGTATITAKVGSKSYTCKVTVETPSLSKKSLTLVKGTSYTLKLSGTTQKITWNSSNTKIATVSPSGKVTGKKNGTATIAAKIGSKKYTCKVAVETPSLSKTSLTMCVGKTATLTLKNTKQSVKWSSSNTKIATVSSSGKITAKATGTATIYAKVLNKTYNCKVKVLSATAYKYYSNRELVKQYVMKYGADTESDTKIVPTSHADSTNPNYYSELEYDPEWDTLTFSTNSLIGEKTFIFSINLDSTSSFIYMMADESTEDFSMAIAEEVKPSSITKDTNLTFMIISTTNDDVQKLSNEEMHKTLTLLEEVLKNTVNLSLADIGFTKY